MLLQGLLQHLVAGISWLERKMCDLTKAKCVKGLDSRLYQPLVWMRDGYKKLGLPADYRDESHLQKNHQQLLEPQNGTWRDCGKTGIVRLAGHGFAPAIVEIMASVRRSKHTMRLQISKGSTAFGQGFDEGEFMVTFVTTKAVRPAQQCSEQISGPRQAVAPKKCWGSKTETTC